MFWCGSSECWKLQRSETTGAAEVDFLYHSNPKASGLFGLKGTEGSGSRWDRELDSFCLDKRLFVKESKEAAGSHLTSSGKVTVLCWRHLDRDRTHGALESCMKSLWVILNNPISSSILPPRICFQWGSAGSGQPRSHIVSAIHDSASCALGLGSDGNTGMF